MNLVHELLLAGADPDFVTKGGETAAKEILEGAPIDREILDEKNVSGITLEERRDCILKMLQAASKIRKGPEFAALLQAGGIQTPLISVEKPVLQTLEDLPSWRIDDLRVMMR